jgi:GT2 family glycosyltransferase
MSDASAGGRHARPAAESGLGEFGEFGERDLPSVRGDGVVAVIVAHNGARWLPDLIAALARQTVRPGRVYAVDTGSRDDSGALLRAAYGEANVQTLPVDAGYGAAAAAALAAADRQPADPTAAPASGPSYVWLLHDDCLPADDCLAELLAGFALPGRASTGVVGPKVLDAADGRTLLEVGVTISRSGRRETGVEPREVDQGQHDDRDQVLAVGTAGMLVRRDVWDRLGGFDPELPLFRDDVDFGWRARRAGYQVRVATRAVVLHAQAASRGRRTLDAGGVRRRHLADRRNALYVLLANLPVGWLVVAYGRLVLASLVRAIGFLLGKLPGLAIDELAALGAILCRPGRVVRARRARRGLRERSAREVMTYLAPRSAQLHRILDSLGRPFEHGGQATDLAARGHRAAHAGSVDEAAESLEGDRLAWVRAARHTGVLVTAAAVLVAVAAARGLFGSGRLLGGALLPAPTGAHDLWATFTAAWHDVGLGAAGTAPPYIGVLAALATVLLGHAPLAVDLVLLGAVPLAALTAYLASASLSSDRRVRAWVAASYGMLPATTGAVAAGRIGTAAALVLLPLVWMAAARAIGLGGRAPSWSGAWTAALLLTLAAAFVPAAYVAVGAIALAALGVAVARRAVTVKSAAGVGRSRRGTVAGWVGRVVVLLAVPPLLLLPWSAQVWRHPGLLLLEAGLPGPGLSDPRLAPASVVLQSPGGPGAIPLWLGVPLLLGGLAALLAGARRGAVLASWLVVFVGAGLGIGMSLATVSTATTQTPVAAWPGFAVGVLTAGLIAAVALVAENARSRLGEAAFGWRQPLALLVAVAAAAAPILFAGWWVIRGAGEPLDRADPVVLPEFVAATGAGPDRPRTIVLRRAADDSVTYALLRAQGPRLGDAETGPPASSYAELDRDLADLVSGRGGDLAADLADHAVRYLVVAAPVDADLVATLDSVPTLHRLATSDDTALWQVALPASRLRLERADGTVITGLPAGQINALANVPPGSGNRVAVLAERADPRWVATLDGAPLEAVTIDGWAQGFRVPAAGGRLEITYDNGTRTRWLIGTGVGLLVVVVLALPGARTREEVLP